jgi:hypothetical membrane protein
MLLLGILAPLVFILGTFYLTQKIPNFNYKTTQLSHLGGGRNHQK